MFFPLMKSFCNAKEDSTRHFYTSLAVRHCLTKRSSWLTVNTYPEDTKTLESITNTRENNLINFDGEQAKLHLQNLKSKELQP